MLASAFERELQGVGARPTYTKRTPDKERESFYTIKQTVYDMDEHGFPCNPKRVYERVPTWAHNDSKYFTTSGSEQPSGWSADSPWMEAVANEPSIATTGGEMVNDFNRTGAGFEPHEVSDLYDDGKPLKCTDPIIWDARKQQKRKRSKQFDAWMKWLAHDKLPNYMLAKGAATLKQHYFNAKREGRVYMTRKQMDKVTARFAELGQLVWNHQKS